MNHPPHSYASTPNICDAIGLSLLQTGNVSMPRIILVLLLSACWANSSQGEVRRPKSPTHVLGTQVLRSKRYTTPHNAASVLLEHGPAAAHTVTAAKPGSAKAACQAMAPSARYVETDLRPLRLMWNSSDGFCGETSVQMIALTRGVWVSQRQARLLGSDRDMTDDVIFDGRTEDTGLYYLLAKRLGFDQPSSSYWDKDNQTLTPKGLAGSNNLVGTVQPTSSQYMTWVKRNILAGRPVITAVRIDTTLPDVWYDHIVPFYGVCSTNTARSAALQISDAVTMSSDYTDEQLRPVRDEDFFAKWQECPYDDSQGEVGCIASDTYNFGIAVGGLAAPAGLYMPSRLLINAWSDGSNPQSEPGETSAAVGNAAMASYALSVSGLIRGKTYTTYRISGSLPGYRLPQSPGELAAVCTAKGSAGCKKMTYAASRPIMVQRDSDLGKFPANSIQYFLTVETHLASQTADATAPVLDSSSDGRTLA